MVAHLLVLLSNLVIYEGRVLLFLRDIKKYLDSLVIGYGGTHTLISHFSEILARAAHCQSCHEAHVYPIT